MKYLHEIDLQNIPFKRFLVAKDPEDKCPAIYERIEEYVDKYNNGTRLFLSHFKSEEEANILCKQLNRE